VNVCLKLDCSYLNDGNDMMKLLKEGHDMNMKYGFESSVAKADAAEYGGTHGGPSDYEYYQGQMIQYVRRAKCFKDCAEALKKKCPDLFMPEFVETFDSRGAEEQAQDMNKPRWKI